MAHARRRPSGPDLAPRRAVPFPRRVEHAPVARSTAEEDGAPAALVVGSGSMLYRAGIGTVARSALAPRRAASLPRVTVHGPLDTAAVEHENAALLVERDERILPPAGQRATLGRPPRPVPAPHGAVSNDLDATGLRAADDHHATRAARARQVRHCVTTARRHAGCARELCLSAARRYDHTEPRGRDDSETPRRRSSRGHVPSGDILQK